MAVLIDSAAPIDTPRRAMGDLLGNAVRFGLANDVLASDEGIETALSLRCARLFSAGAVGLCIAKQNSRASLSSARRCGPPLRSGFWPGPAAAW
jgi:hypothetical protein